MSEKSFLENYSISDYERPSVAADIAVFSVMDTDTGNPKKSAVRKLRLMLIKRGEHPFKGYWALPGGFLQMNESIEECAHRELEEETGLHDFYIRQFRTYSKVDRDPRGRIISCSYISLLNNCSEIVRPSTDAAEAEWFDTEIENTDFGFVLRISDSNGNELVSAEVHEGTNDFSELKNVRGSLAFDHIRIISDAVENIRNTLDTGTGIFSLLPAKFSIPQMQQVYALVKGYAVSKDVIHRLYGNKIEKTADVDSGQHKRAVLYRKK